MTPEMLEALRLLKRALNYLPDNSACEADVREFLHRHDPTWAESYEVGKQFLARMWSE